MEVSFEKIKQENVKKFILRYGLKNLSAFKNIKAICYKSANEDSYHRHFQTYLIKDNIKSVWNTYKSIHPREAWNGEMVSFGLQYSKNNHTISYLEDAYYGIETGQIIILNLRLLWGFINLAVAHQVTEVNEEDHSFKICYLEGIRAEGSQWIKLHETTEGFTEVSHLTLYKSKSSFSDTKLYPWFHNQAISEFHNNVKRKAEQQALLKR